MGCRLLIAISPADSAELAVTLMTYSYRKAGCKAAQTCDEKFNKLEFLNAFNDFRAKALKSPIIRSAWRQTGLVLYNPVLVHDKIREAHPPAPPRPATPPPIESYEFEPL